MLPSNVNSPCTHSKPLGGCVEEEEEEGVRPRNRPIMCVRDGVGCGCEQSIGLLKPRPVRVAQMPTLYSVRHRKRTGGTCGHVEDRWVGGAKLTARPTRPTRGRQTPHGRRRCPFR
eukprot:383779-Prymnesium_polylepis.1